MFVANVTNNDNGFNVSTLAGTGYNNSNSISPYQVMATSQITSAVLTVSSLSTKINNSSFPYYAWMGIYRINYTTRNLIGVIEFQITTPTTVGSGVGVDNIGVQLLATDTSTSTDGVYIANRVLNKTPGNPPLTLANIPLQNGWIIGMELLLAQNTGGSTFSAIQEGAGSTSYLWGNTTPVAVRPYAQSITGYKNPIITLTTS